MDTPYDDTPDASTMQPVDTERFRRELARVPNLTQEQAEALRERFRRELDDAIQELRAAMDELRAAADAYIGSR